MKNTVVLAGNYGSGKTELSLNLALKAAKTEASTVLVDMDIVNPYFRAAEHKDMLYDNGIELIAPTYANTTVDVPVISADIKRAFNFDYSFFDAGGDPVGAAVLGSVVEYFDVDNTDFYYVVNARRPLQRNAVEIIKMLEQIASRARLKMTGIINNTNLARETSVLDLEEGLEVCRSISEDTGLPIAFSAATRDIAEGFLKRHPGERVEIIEIFTRPYWLDIT